MGKWTYAASACALAVVLATYWIMVRDIANTTTVKLTGTDKAVQQTPGRLEAAIKSGADYLVRNCGRDGRFVYRLNMDKSVPVRRKYNMLRHCGTMYALAMYNDRYPSQEVVDVLRRAGIFLRAQIGSVDGQKEIRAVWSNPEITNSHSPRCAKLGGTGLGLVALCCLEKHLPFSTDINVLRSMGEFIVWMQKEDGSFYSKYLPPFEGRSDRWNSLYYPGEAALGLLLLYELDPNPKWLNASAKAIGYLAMLRRGLSYVEADHWALIATAKLLPLCEKTDVGITRGLLSDHAFQIVDRMLNDRICDSDNPVLDGGFTDDGRTCPAATRLEGLIAASEFLQYDDEARQIRLLAAIENGIEFLLAVQVKNGEYRGGFPRAVVQLEGCGKDVEYFNRRATEIRIDYVQHAICAMLASLDAGINIR